MNIEELVLVNLLNLLNSNLILACRLIRNELEPYQDLFKEGIKSKRKKKKSPNQRFKEFMGIARKNKRNQYNNMNTKYQVLQISKIIAQWKN